MAYKNRKEKNEIFASLAGKEEQRKAAPKTTLKKPANKNEAHAEKQPSGRSSAPPTKPTKERENLNTLQVDEVTKACIELIVGTENNGTYDGSDERIASLEAMVESLSDDLKRCNDRINELETNQKRMHRSTRTEE